MIGLYFEDIPEEIFTLELPKVPAQSDGTGGWDWLQFLRSKTKEEFEMVAAKNPEIRKAVNTLYELSADEKVRAEYEQRQKAWRDREAVYEYKLDRALENSLQEVARRMKNAGRPLSEIAEFSDLPLELISQL
jgi:predicted transposase/invertase (TIGR01784 family)